MNDADRPALLVVEITMTRDDAWYHDELEQLTGHTVRVAHEQGWVTRRLPMGDVDEAAIAEGEAWADAIVVMGGEDIAPAFYDGAPQYEGQGLHHPVADGRTIDLIRRAVAARTPLLGICRGQQLVNVALGGTLIQHLPVALDHEPPRAAASFIRHPVALAPDSVLGRRLGDEAIAVDSAHHQAVDRLGEGLRVTALAPDGTVEGLEHVAAPVVCVQWHPEYEHADARQLVALFGELAQRVRARAGAAAPAA